jgi:hypothetical protein
LFVKVTVAVDVPPTAVLANVKLVGLIKSGAIPVPVSFTSCGLVVALSVNVSAPVTAPVTLGLNVTFTVQLPFATTDPEQLSVSLKSPLAAIDPILSGPVPELLSVTDFTALLFPAA